MCQLSLSEEANFFSNGAQFRDERGCALFQKENETLGNRGSESQGRMPTEGRATAAEKGCREMLHGLQEFSCLFIHFWQFQDNL